MQGTIEGESSSSRSLIAHGGAATSSIVEALGGGRSPGASARHNSRPARPEHIA
jgi:hypothetical protein